MNRFGTCECESALRPIWFVEKETAIINGCMYKTGRERLAVDVLVCPTCFKEYSVDDSLDRPWNE